MDSDDVTRAALEAEAVRTRAEPPKMPPVRAAVSIARVAKPSAVILDAAHKPLPPPSLIQSPETTVGPRGRVILINKEVRTMSENESDGANVAPPAISVPTQSGMNVAPPATDVPALQERIGIPGKQSRVVKNQNHEYPDTWLCNIRLVADLRSNTIPIKRAKPYNHHLL
jgi:hypothetical protein